MLTRWTKRGGKRTRNTFCDGWVSSSLFCYIFLIFHYFFSFSHDLVLNSDKAFYFERFVQCFELTSPQQLCLIFISDVLHASTPIRSWVVACYIFLYFFVFFKTLEKLQLWRQTVRWLKLQLGKWVVSHKSPYQFISS